MDYKIGVLGLGKLGMPFAEILAEKYKVVGYDIFEKESKLENLTIAKNFNEAIQDNDVIFITVQTPHNPIYDGTQPTSCLEPEDFNYEYVKNAITDMQPYLKEGASVVVVSTILPTTSRTQFLNLFQNESNRNNYFYSPFLIALDTVVNDIYNPEIIMIGQNNASDEAIKMINDIYRNIIKNDPEFIQGTIEDIECLKVFHNVFINLKITFMNMIQEVSENIGNVNVDLLSKAFINSSHKIIGPKFFTAGMGSGGPCHPRDNIALSYLSKSLNLNYDLFGTISEIRELQTKNMAKSILNKVKDYNNIQIVILGKSYKPGTDYDFGSPAYLLNYYLENEIKNEPYNDKKINLNIENEDTNSIYDKVIYVNTHMKGFEDYNFQNNSIIFDVYRKMDSEKYKNKNIKLIKYGYTYPE